MELSNDVKKLMEDPRWQDIEDILMERIAPLMDFNTIDLTQPAEHVKAEVIARKLAYNSIADFLNDNVLVNKPIKKVVNPFQ